MRLIWITALVMVMTTPSYAASCGLASWYGAESGNKTASGKFFDGSQMLAAHKTLPLGTRIRVTYNGRSIDLPVEDRGPYIKGRIIDLSKAAFKRLASTDAGVIRVCYTVVR